MEPGPSGLTLEKKNSKRNMTQKIEFQQHSAPSTSAKVNCTDEKKYYLYTTFIQCSSSVTNSLSISQQGFDTRMMFEFLKLSERVDVCVSIVQRHLGKQFVVTHTMHSTDKCGCIVKM